MDDSSNSWGKVGNKRGYGIKFLRKMRPTHSRLLLPKIPLHDVHDGFNMNSMAEPVAEEDCNFECNVLACRDLEPREAS